jgi:hypothetical protein
VNQFAALALGVAATVGVIVLQFILPFAFDFITTIAVYALGVIVGREMAKSF